MTPRDVRKALLFDLDGTVVDTLELIFKCYDYTMRNRCGCEGSRQIWEQCVGLSLRDIFSTTLRHFDIAATELMLAEAVTNYRDFLRDNESAVSTFPGMRESLIELFNRGWRMAIVTTKITESAMRHLQSQQLTQLFDVVIGSDQCENLKPHPEPFRKAMEMLGVSPKNSVAIGDSEHDIRSARAAGARTVAACWGTLSREKLLAAEPNLIADRPADLLALTH